MVNSLREVRFFIPIRIKILLFIVCFSAVFVLWHKFVFSDPGLLVSELGGIPWLYSTVGLIFSVVAAFTIQKEWELWNTLVDAVKSEVDELHELWLWSQHFPNSIRERFHQVIILYLTTVVSSGLGKNVHGEQSKEEERVLISLNNVIYDIFSTAPELVTTSFSLFTGVLGFRSRRQHLSSSSMPVILRNALLFNGSLLIFLSFFIGVTHVLLDYVFTLSIAALVFLIFLVIDDLDHPLRPGSWHISDKAYRDLLKRIEEREETMYNRNS